MPGRMLTGTESWLAIGAVCWATTRRPSAGGVSPKRRMVPRRRRRMGDTKGIVERNIESWNAHDKTAWTRDIADDGELTAPGGISGSGRELRDMFYALWTDAFPDNEIKPKVIVVDGENAVLEATFEGTHTGVLNAPTGPIQPTR